MNHPRILGHDKRQNLRKIGIEEEKIQIKGTENTFIKIMHKNFLTLRRKCLSKSKKNTKHQIH